MKLLALGKPIKKPPCSDERDGELFCGTSPIVAENTASFYCNGSSLKGVFTKGQTYSFSSLTGNNHTLVINLADCDTLSIGWSNAQSTIFYNFFADGELKHIESRYSAALSNFDVSAYDYVITTRVYDGINRSFSVSFTAS